MLHKILVALNNNELGQQVFAEALSLAKKTDAELMLLNVISPRDERQPTLPEIVVDNIYQCRFDDLNSYLNQWESLQREGIEFLILLTNKAIAAGVNAEYTQEFGDPSRMICEIARTWGADLIIIGRRGLKGISELLLGSVSNYVLHHAPCSVLTVQGKMYNASQQATTQLGQYSFA